MAINTSFGILKMENALAFEFLSVGSEKLSVMGLYLKNDMRELSYFCF